MFEEFKEALVLITGYYKAPRIHIEHLTFEQWRNDIVENDDIVEFLFRRCRPNLRISENSETLFGLRPPLLKLHERRQCEPMDTDS